MSKEGKVSEEIIQHRHDVLRLVRAFTGELEDRAYYHDRSKLDPEEFNIYVECIPKLKNIEYGSKQYKECLKEMKVALDHHYKHNQHHPEHFENGVGEMTLMDVVEMLCDWKAASSRQKDADFANSLKITKERFKIDEQLASILLNTAKYFEWL